LELKSEIVTNKPTLSLQQTSSSSSSLSSSSSVLHTLNLPYNLFTDDILYTFGNMLPYNRTLQMLDLTGTIITTAGGIALANGIKYRNFTLLYVDLDVTDDDDDDDHKTTHTEQCTSICYNGTDDDDDKNTTYNATSWRKDIRYQLLINRMYHVLETVVENSTISARQIGTTLSQRQLIDVIANHSNENLDCIYYFIRNYFLQ
jgi:hypothetical protein